MELGWANKEAAARNPTILDDVVDDIPVRGKRSLFEIYQRGNVVVLDPAEFEEAEKDDKWINAMKEELKMIEKNDTWKLVEKPQPK